MTEHQLPRVDQIGETHALWLVLEKHDDEAKEIIDAMLESERREFRTNLRFLLRLTDGSGINARE